ncbi:TetR family transcriptional regulator [Alkalibacter saccharofermentans]|uniref:Transcriptional regulator, TetR family n=1 Tax=Alkalibacter saccharofermentans DSM 14828 TaxID=1120975 RepID=A0A1M4XRR1_9FIRM|nr:TetR family transcriptional regulator [Alkalibacter saccharofermentans]SHE96274.1 transcriptional regulator, TetR family [Alkalibacter saccharofermentans DSM 14828]
MKDKNEKRNKLLLASMTLIKKNGFENTSVSQIVKEAGVAQGTFYLYFHSKNALVPAIASQIFDEQLLLIKDRYDESVNSLESLLQILVDVTYEITEKHKDLINFLYSGFAYDNSFETWENIYRPYYSWLETSLNSLKEKSLLTIEMNYSYLANFVVGLIEHGAESVFLSNTSVEEKNRSKEQLLRFLNHTLEPKLYL